MNETYRIDVRREMPAPQYEKLLNWFYDNYSEVTIITERVVLSQERLKASLRPENVAIRLGKDYWSIDATCYFATRATMVRFQIETGITSDARDAQSCSADKSTLHL